MIFRLTSKLSKKIGMANLPSIPVDSTRNHLLDWNAHVFIAERRQYIIVANTESLYSIILHGRGVSGERQFLRQVLACMYEFMTLDGNEDLFEKYIEPETYRVFFSKTVDRRVTGSMNDLIFQARYYLSTGNLSLQEISLRLNSVLLSYLEYRCPRKNWQVCSSLTRKISAKITTIARLPCIEYEVFANLLLVFSHLLEK